MKEIHDFSTPRNLFEKLNREYNKLSDQVNGDHIFNFVSTAFHLQHWIKQSPVSKTEVGKRLLRKIAREKSIKHCQSIAKAKEHFRVEVEKDDAILFVGSDVVDLNEFKDTVFDLYSNYFKIKGH